MKRLLRTVWLIIVSPMFMGTLFIVLAVAMGIATFVENDFGAGAARGLIYGSWWFELLFLLAAINLAGQIIRHRLYRRKKISIFLFHTAFILIMAGAAITRYTGFEGVMHIRSGEEKDYCLTSDSYLGLRVEDRSGRLITEDYARFNIDEAASGKYHRKLVANRASGSVSLTRIIRNATEILADTPDGEPAVSLIITGTMGSYDNVIMRAGEKKQFGSRTVGFMSDEPVDIDIILREGAFFLVSGDNVTGVGMDGGENVGYMAGEEVPFRQMVIYSSSGLRIIPRTLTLSGMIRPVPADPSGVVTGMNAIEMRVVNGTDIRTVWLWEGKDEELSDMNVKSGDLSIALSLGHRRKPLPFTLRLDKFTLDRYPGSLSPSGYSSDVTVRDKVNGIEKSCLIYMNNILKHGGYRFYQSSYDTDEKGTVLSVQRDRAGIAVTYSGYGLMVLFMLISLMNPSSVFRTISGNYWVSSLRKASLFLLILVSSPVISPAMAQDFVADRKVADQFGSILVQDQKGRTKPLYTLSSDILRKVSRSNDFSGYSPMQVFLGFYFDFESWKDVPLISVRDKTIRNILGIKTDKAAFSDIIDLSARQGAYRLQGLVTEAHSQPLASRSGTDKELIRLDERVNICYMIYAGQFMRIFPLRDGRDKWGNIQEALQHAGSSSDSLFLETIMSSLYESMRSGRNSEALELIRLTREYQRTHTMYDIAGARKVRAEVIYYKLRIFERLFPVYLATGALMLLLLLFRVVFGCEWRELYMHIVTALLFAGFLVHSYGLGLRWYVSGHSPMSNGYETMIFISWVTMLAGFIFRGRSVFVLPATGVLSGLTLLVAHMSFMDPEITALVPVLQSYWLTLHVSVITGSYGFLGLGALLGLISLLLIALSNSGNTERTGKVVDELTVINYMSLTIGLYLLTTGTFLGAVWANESWGRYWGWDPKETWSLITIIVYSFVIHSGMIPALKDVYTFNLLSLFSVASVLMTFFGVNYYLSGLHSYAGGDPVPVPLFVYLSVAAVLLLAIVSHYKYSRLHKT